MTDLASLWRACRVRRWHTNTELAGTDDRVDGHSGRVARIILLLNWQPSAALIKAALIHDDGEWGTGDIARPVKAALRRSEPAAWERFEACEDECLAHVWRAFPALDEAEAIWLRFADRLDAYLWAMHHGAKLDRNGWPQDREWLHDTAISLGVEAQFLKAVK